MGKSSTYLGSFVAGVFVALYLSYQAVISTLAVANEPYPTRTGIGNTDGDGTVRAPILVSNPQTNEAILKFDRALELKDDASPESKKFLNEVILQIVQHLSTISQYYSMGRPDTKQGNVTAVCTICEIFVGYAFLQVRFHLNTLEITLRNFKYLCPQFNILTTHEVCIGMIDRIIPTIYFLVKHRPNLNVEAFCGYTFQQLGCNTDDPYLDWSVSVEAIRNEYSNTPLLPQPQPLPPPTPTSHRLHYQNINSRNQVRKKLVKIAQLTDVHVDPKYTYKSEAVCDTDILCCERTSKPKLLLNGSYARVETGFFGDSHKCDSVVDLLERTLIHLKAAHPDIELFYMTGDFVPHNVWSTTRETNIDTMRTCSNLFQKYFPQSAVKIFPMVGNHDVHPINQFSPEQVPQNLNTRWIYREAYSQWKQWIPADQAANFYTEGFYSVEVSSSLKIVAINTNVCYGFNFWGMYNVRDPGGQLVWLNLELLQAEGKGQFVHILGHIPPGSQDCNKVWSRNFYEIITRFKRTVKAHFYGHTHFDELKLFYDPINVGEPISPLFISPSLTSYELNNPAYKLFYADPQSWEVLDYETWIFDLEEANKRPDREPIWFPLYKATTAYGIPNTDVRNLGILMTKMAENKHLFDLFNQHYYKALPRQRKPSSVRTQKNSLCNIVTAYPTANSSECHRIKNIIDFSNHLKP